MEKVLLFFGIFLIVAGSLSLIGSRHLYLFEQKMSHETIVNEQSKKRNNKGSTYFYGYPPVPALGIGWFINNHLYVYHPDGKMISKQEIDEIILKDRIKGKTAK